MAGLRVCLRVCLSIVLCTLQRLRQPVSVVVLLFAGGLSACTPAYDWRTIMNNDNGYTVDLPTKPGADEREIDIGGIPMKMMVQTAEAGDAVFMVGTVMLPDDQALTQQSVLAFLRTGLARNLRAAPDFHAVPIPLAAGDRCPASK